MMTDTMNLGLKTLDQAAVDAFDPQTFSDMVDREARQANFMRRLAVEVSDALVGSAGSAHEYRFFGGLNASDKSEGNKVSASDNTYSTTTVNTDIEKQVVVEITKEAADDSNVDDLDLIAEEIGIAHADAFAQEMYDMVSDFSALVTSGNALEHEVASTDSIDFGDVKDAAYRELGAANRTGDSLIVHPVVYASMLEDNKLVKADELGDDVVIREGEESASLKLRVAGVDVWVSTVANNPGGTTDEVVGVMLDTSAAFVAVYKNRPGVQQDEFIGQRKTELSSFERYGKAVLNEDAICLLTNA